MKRCSEIYCRDARYKMRVAGLRTHGVTLPLCRNFQCQMTKAQGISNVQNPRATWWYRFVRLTVGCSALGKQSRGRMDWGAPSELEMFWAVILGLRSQGSLQPRLLYGGPSGLGRDEDGGRTRLNSLKLAKTLILKFFLFQVLWKPMGGRNQAS
jgi:hypothetical protein